MNDMLDTTRRENDTAECVSSSAIRLYLVVLDSVEFVARCAFVIRVLHTGPTGQCLLRIPA
jgi:hypothetical protein